MDFDRLSSRYVGPAAKRYDAERDLTPKWDREQAELSTVLGRLERNSTVVDIPVGTGRCFELYAAQGLCVTGLDISPDMLAEALSRAESVGLTVDLRRGDIRKIDAGDRAFETAVCIRFLNWIEMPDVEIVVRELVRVARTNLVLAIRHYVPPSGWKLSATDAKRLPNQIVRRVRKRFEGPGLVIHSKRSVEALFTKFDLDVVTATCIQNRGDGTDYFIYHLQKRA